MMVWSDLPHQPRRMSEGMNETELRTMQEDDKKAKFWLFDIALRKTKNDIHCTAFKLFLSMGLVGLLKILLVWYDSYVCFLNYQ